MAAIFYEQDCDQMCIRDSLLNASLLKLLDRYRRRDVIAHHDIQIAFDELACLYAVKTLSLIHIFPLSTLF